VLVFWLKQLLLPLLSSVKLLLLNRDKLKNSQLHRNRDFRNHFLRIRNNKDQVFKKWTLRDLRDQAAALKLSKLYIIKITNKT